MLFQEKPNGKTPELAFVRLANLDPAPAMRAFCGRFCQWRLGHSQQQRKDPLRDQLAGFLLAHSFQNGQQTRSRFDDFGADFGIRIGGMTFEQVENIGPSVIRICNWKLASAQDPNGFAANTPVLIPGQWTKQTQVESALIEFDLGDVETFQGPKGGNTASSGLRRITDDLLKSGAKLIEPAIDNGLPGQMILGKRFAPEFEQQIATSHFLQIGHLKRSLLLMAHPPNASACFVAFRVISRHFIVRNDFVVPIHNVEAAVRAEMNRYRAKHCVAGLDKIRKLL